MKTVAELIAVKRAGASLTAEEIHWLIRGYASGAVPDYQMAAMAMAIYFNGLTPAELGPWTDAMLHSGQVIDLSHVSGRKVDKHSTGGVGDKISLPLAPLVGACGVKVPMISGRGLGHTGGTLDKLESIPGFTTALTVQTFIDQVDRLGVGLIGQTGEVCPADKKLYALRDVTATVESIPLISSSIMSKKLAEGIDGLVLDVKVGSGAFMKTVAQARELAHTMVKIGSTMGKDVVALLTDMNQPLGRMVGNALEVKESIEILKNAGPSDVRALTLALAEDMLRLGGVDPAQAEIALSSGRALELFGQIIEAQGGDPRVIDDPRHLPTAQDRVSVTADRTGYVQTIDTRRVGLATVALGAGRKVKEDDVDPAVGLEVAVRLGDWVEQGQPLFWIHHNGRGLDQAVAHLEASLQLSDETVSPPPLIIERIESI
ncbi:MAG: thymidine phosphorylase [Myxococcota bacterium]|nr:thymidine phosphorylase [Myxococcota bacterium]